MENIYKYADSYFTNCSIKNLNPMTIKAYRIDLTQFITFAKTHSNPFERSCINDFASELRKKYKPSTIKRKLASIHSFYYFLECEDIIKRNPFNTLKIRIPVQYSPHSNADIQHLEIFSAMIIPFLKPPCNPLVFPRVFLKVRLMT